MLAPPKISIRAHRFRLVVKGVETVVGTSLDVVIVASNPYISKKWFSKPYTGAIDVSRECWSLDGVTPDASVERPFCANCAACPNNIPDLTQVSEIAEGVVCLDRRYLAVLPMADPTRVYTLTVVASAIEVLREYMEGLSKSRHNSESVVTRLGFNDKVDFPKLTFTKKGFVAKKVLGAVKEIGASEEAMRATRQDTCVSHIDRPDAAANPDMANLSNGDAGQEILAGDSMDAALKAMFPKD